MALRVLSSILAKDHADKVWVLVFYSTLQSDLCIGYFPNVNFETSVSRFRKRSPFGRCRSSLASLYNMQLFTDLGFPFA